MYFSHPKNEKKQIILVLPALPVTRQFYLIDTIRNRLQLVCYHKLFKFTNIYLLEI